jgi:hypothetical protein
VGAAETVPETNCHPFIFRLWNNEINALAFGILVAMTRTISQWRIPVEETVL